MIGSDTTCGRQAFIPIVLAQEARRVKEQAKTLPEGKERELLSRKARQLETASRINDWILSPGLQPPK